MDFGIDRIVKLVLWLAAALGATVTSVGAEPAFRGPVAATVLEVIDGDTFLAEAHVWPGQTVRINVRIRGIDAPEMKSRCGAERTAALRARMALADIVAGREVAIADVGGAKMYGRVLADVFAADGAAVAPRLLASDLVRPYYGGRRGGWC